ncbi:hypothetical protein ACOME3_001092 [Neoechinorhynchus agilis]
MGACSSKNDRELDDFEEERMTPRAVYEEITEYRIKGDVDDPSYPPLSTPEKQHENSPCQYLICRKIIKTTECVTTTICPLNAPELPGSGVGSYRELSSSVDDLEDLQDMTCENVEATANQLTFYTCEDAESEECDTLKTSSWYSLEDVCLRETGSQSTVEQEIEEGIDSLVEATVANCLNALEQTEPYLSSKEPPESIDESDKPSSPEPNSNVPSNKVPVKVHEVVYSLNEELKCVEFEPEVESVAVVHASDATESFLEANHESRELCTETSSLPLLCESEFSTELVEFVDSLVDTVLRMEEHEDYFDAVEMENKDVAGNDSKSHRNAIQLTAERNIEEAVEFLMGATTPYCKEASYVTLDTTDRQQQQYTSGDYLDPEMVTIVHSLIDEVYRRNELDKCLNVVRRQHEDASETLDSLVEMARDILGNDEEERRILSGRREMESQLDTQTNDSNVFSPSFNPNGLTDHHHHHQQQ